MPSSSTAQIYTKQKRICFCKLHCYALGWLLIVAYIKSGTSLLPSCAGQMHNLPAPHRLCACHSPDHLLFCLVGLCHLSQISCHKTPHNSRAGTLNKNIFCCYPAPAFVISAHIVRCCRVSTNRFRGPLTDGRFTMPKTWYQWHGINLFWVHVPVSA